ncbi:HotDog domain-containing protein [Xylariales sp. AK1849]|nr:HotDog domain-containing protein [Xylariales sp. AK1849]
MALLTMFRPRQVSKLYKAWPIHARLLPVTVRGEICCSKGFRIASSQRLSPRTFATSSTQREAPKELGKQPLNAQDATAAEVLDHGPHPGPTPRPKPKRRRRRGLVYAALFLLLGTSIGSLFRLSISPPPLPLPGSDQDTSIVSSIHAKAAELPIVQSLSSDPSWTSWDAYTESPPRGPRVTSGPMSGSRGLAYQRIFHNRETGELVSVIYFGGALSGWPGVVHGGALATVLDESLGRCAILRFPARTGVTARLELTYKKPTVTNAFYVIRVKPVLGEGDNDLVGKDGTRKSDRKLWVEGNVATEEGKICVEAKALFVVPKGSKLKPLSEGF